jgi:catechol 2,3-dioxygenase-like lactoylglutathione lyase family enzyme
MSTTTSLVTGVDFAVIPTRDFDRAVDFYENILGLERSIQYGSHPGMEFETGNLTLAVMDLEFFGGTNAPAAPIALRVDDAFAAKEALEAHGVEFGPHVDSGACHQIFFADPDGNPLILHQRYKPREA